jgi:2-polyprenyl-3-methyl-5-hydroxy-6-metoxy-1,4-benzoquinol methylase
MESLQPSARSPHVAVSPTIEPAETDFGRCQICKSAELAEIPGYRTLPRVTSDCVPFRDGGRLLVCHGCGAAQSPADSQWFSEIQEIYGAYQCYQQSGGIEQHVPDPATGSLRRRSDVLLDRLYGHSEFPRQGTVLDVGCGGGGTLRAFSGRGGWQLYGLEMSDRSLPMLREIQGFERLYTCPVRDLPRQFDGITMIHALEHFPDPEATLRDLRGALAPGGRLFVEVPDSAANPFDYLIADHRMHFTAQSLAALATRAEFVVETMSTVWVRKELSMIAARETASAYLPPHLPGSETVARIEAQLHWLTGLVEAATLASRDSACFGLFGSSIAATWLSAVLGDRVSFFVEEDEHRIGHTHLGRPILRASELPSGRAVFVPLIPRIALQVATRLQAYPIRVFLPPETGGLDW